MEEPEILKDEVRSTLAKMNRNKAARPDGIVTNAFSFRRLRHQQDHRSNKRTIKHWPHTGEPHKIHLRNIT